ncbi:MAG: aspartate ammonia-lyase [Candidatus Rokubacteria bacterium]|nr:aspartate ammonia-lyase [Candidatus Rokubacteria bacterium]MBI3824567.1 aspartate ammonia-lyase [Candidatus Rokubacteria bacterium]
MRRERDSLGVKSVPARALWGIFTERARTTFDLSGRPPHPALVRAYARIKKAAALANARLGRLPTAWARAIAGAADRVIAGEIPDAAVIDRLQAGAGTPSHMNVNEVIANLANERLGGRRGAYAPIHPNNHVNIGQSSNDVTPTAIRLMALELRRPLLAELAALERALRGLARREATVVKPGRTHFQDAVPITYGQVFRGWAEAIRDAGAALEVAAGELRAIGLGGTAVGTGLTAHPRFATLVARQLSRLTGERLRPARSAVTTTWSLRPLLACSAALRGIAVDLGNVCFDLRLLASGPHTGLGELLLPEVEPGSSIMPGKVNPSVVEAVQMACLEARAHDHAVALAAAAGELELNVMTPLVAAALGDAFDVLTRAVRLLRTRCVAGLRVDRARVAALMRGSLVEATALSPYLGYEVTAELVKEALASKRPLRAVVRARALLDEATLARLLRPAALTGPALVDRRLQRRVRASPAFRAFHASLATRASE